MCNLIIQTYLYPYNDEWISEKSIETKIHVTSWAMSMRKKEQWEDAKKEGREGEQLRAKAYYSAPDVGSTIASLFDL